MTSVTQQSVTLPMFEIEPRLYLSRFPDSIPSELTHILNMCIQPHPDDPSRTYLHIPLDDIDNITSEISRIVDFINQAVGNDGTVLVYCALGLNRSAAAILSYLCHKKKINALQALKLLKERKSDVKPSAIFLKRIDQFYGRVGETEDLLVGFHRRLQQRKMAALSESKKQ